MNMRIDLHTHTTASDGRLSPLQLIERARDRKVDMLSITDHDTIDAYGQLSETNIKGIRLIPGIEFSTQWKKLEIHILGLNVALNNTVLKQGILIQKEARLERVHRIIRKFKKLDITVPLSRLDGDPENASIGRPHFARYLVDSDLVKNEKEAFDKFLKPGKPAYCEPRWPPPGEIINWIHSAGGFAVLAHPFKYRLTRTKLNALIDDFILAGGEALETVSGRHDPAHTLELVRICNEKNLLASCGSDFHQPGQPWAELGNVAPLPQPELQIWRNW